MGRDLGPVGVDVQLHHGAPPRARIRDLRARTERAHRADRRQQAHWHESEAEVTKNREKLGEAVDTFRGRALIRKRARLMSEDETEDQHPGMASATDALAGAAHPG